MTTRDIPYVVFIVICMVATFISGRYSVSVPPATAALITSTPPSIPVPSPVLERDRDPVVPVEELPTIVTSAIVPEIKSVKITSKPVEVKAVGAPVVPEKVELEDDLSAVQNPYKVPKAVASTPGF